MIELVSIEVNWVDSTKRYMIEDRVYLVLLDVGNMVDERACLLNSIMRQSHVVTAPPYDDEDTYMDS